MMAQECVCVCVCVCMYTPSILFYMYGYISCMNVYTLCIKYLKISEDGIGPLTSEITHSFEQLLNAENKPWIF